MSVLRLVFLLCLCVLLFLSLLWLLLLLLPPVIKISGILTWIGEFRPGNKTIHVVFDEESDLLGPRT